MHDFTRRSRFRGHRAGGGRRANRTGAPRFCQGLGASPTVESRAGAKLTVMRWKRFVPAEDDAFNAMVAAFKTATGTEMNVFSESFEDVQPQSFRSRERRLGSRSRLGPAYVAAAFPTKVLKMNDVADYLGKKYGGWIRCGTEHLHAGQKTGSAFPSRPSAAT